MMKKSIRCLLLLFVLSVFCASMTVCAKESEADAAQPLKYEMLGYTVSDPNGWEGLKGSLLIYPASTTSINENPELYAAYLYYFPVPNEVLESEENAAAAIQKMTIAGMLFTVKGDRDQLWEALNDLEVVEPEDNPEDLVKVGEAEDYQFFLLGIQDEEYAASVEEEYKEDYKNLPALLQKEMEQAEYYAPVDPMNAMEGQTIRFTTTDLDGNTLTSEELFGENTITMVNLWGVWCPNCVNEMEELARIHERLQEKGCGIVGIEWEQNPGEEIYQQARDLMEEKGTNYPSVLMPEDNELLNGVSSYPATFFVDREGTILTKPILGARVSEYEPTLDALLDAGSDPQTQSEEAEGLTYRVYVKDEEDQPLAGVIVQFCDDTSCRLGETDEDGCAAFEVSEKKDYEIHIMKAPDGYTFDKEEIFHANEDGSDTTIVLK